MNTFGNNFRLTTFGESHGIAIGGIVDGCPAGIAFDNNLIASEMNRRHDSVNGTTRQEPDEVEILSGILDGKTLGTPIAFVIRNKDAHSEDYAPLQRLQRPGHADYTWEQRFGLRDWRGGGRAAGRETAARVVGGAIAKIILSDKQIAICSEIVEQGIAGEGDSAGGVVECTISGLRAGIGDPVFNKLNARLAAALMSIPSAIGFEMGAGFAAARMQGSEYMDRWNSDHTTQSNHCGGVQGGISNGMPVVCRVAFHPVVSIAKSIECIDNEGNIETVTLSGRHDRCHVARTAVVVEAMAAMTVADFLLGEK